MTIPDASTVTTCEYTVDPLRQDATMSVPLAQKAVQLSALTALNCVLTKCFFGLCMYLY